MPPFMAEALRQAQAAFDAGETPVGAVIVRNGAVIAAAGNRVEADADPTAHAEMLAIRAACAALSAPRLQDCDLYVTLEPCAMCAQAISHARLRRLYFAAYDAKGGGVEHGPQVFRHSTCHHRPEVYGGLLAEESGAMLKAFFQSLRKS